jgi:integrase
MRSQRGAHGRFASLYGTTTLRLKAEFAYPAGAPRYELFVFDGAGQLIVALNAWYLLMEGVGATRTRNTYLAVLRPWFGFLSERGYAWNARPEAVREYTRQFLLEAGCAIQPGRIDGWFVQATNQTPISTNGLHLLVAALRNFYEVMRRGVFDDQDGEAHPLYPYENPMYSRTLLAWRTEHRKWIRNAGAPEHAGIRSETRASSSRLPVGYFQVRRQPLEPPVAREAEATRFVILAGIRYMIDHASARESVILRILLESGARVSEVLGLTAGGLRSAQNPKIGIDVAALVRDKGSHQTSKPIWFSQQTRDHLQRYIAHDRSKLDSQGSTRLDQLEDDAPIFLSYRKRQFGYSGFRLVFGRLLRKAQDHFRSRSQASDLIRVALPTITPHTIRHLHTTFRVTKVRELFPSQAERERALEVLVSDMGWRSSDMLKTYDHAMTKAELRERMASDIRQMVQDAPFDFASLQALLRRQESSSQPVVDGDDAPGTLLSKEAQETLVWLDEL